MRGIIVILDPGFWTWRGCLALAALTVTFSGYGMESARRRRPRRGPRLRHTVGAGAGAVCLSVPSGVLSVPSGVLPASGRSVCSGGGDRPDASDRSRRSGGGTVPASEAVWGSGAVRDASALSLARSQRPDGLRRRPGVLRGGGVGPALISETGHAWILLGWLAGSGHAGSV